VAGQALVCPACQAPGAAGPDANDEYLCVYCGTRFHRPSVSGPAPQPVVVKVDPAAVASASRTQSALILVAVGVLFLAAVLALVVVRVLGRSDDSSASGSGSAQVASARAPERTKSKPVTLPPSSSVSAKAPARPKPEPEAPATASFEFHGTQSSYQSSYYALGVITNTSPFIIDKPKVIAVLLDAEGKELGTDFGFAALDVLGPGDSSPVKILIKDPPEHDSLRFEVAVRKASYVPSLAESLRVEAMEPRPAQFSKNGWEVEGKVHNEGTQRAKFVQIYIQAFGAEGKLVGLGTTFADAEVLEPGATARFSSPSMFTSGEVDHFEFSVSGRVAD
jgi:hypothetical protein